MTDQQIRELAEKHYEWLESVLDVQREMEHKLFVDAFIHGWKHRDEEDKDDR